jgi:hypothetical protein
MRHKIFLQAGTSPTRLQLSPINAGEVNTICVPSRSRVLSASDDMPSLIAPTSKDPSLHPSSPQVEGGPLAQQVIRRASGGGLPVTQSLSSVLTEPTKRSRAASISSGSEPSSPQLRPYPHIRSSSFSEKRPSTILTKNPSRSILGDLQRFSANSQGPVKESETWSFLRSRRKTLMQDCSSLGTKGHIESYDYDQYECREWRMDRQNMTDK